MRRFVFVTGGVVSSLGKGLASAALGALLQARGYKVRLRKMDPYLNVDPGTMSPYQHGEVFVTDDGAETDLDLGHYERFTGVPATRSDSVSAGRVYMDVLSRERRGDYLGATVQVIPHVTDSIRQAILADSGDADFVLVEIGGTVGDIEGLPFLEAIRQLGNDMGTQGAMFVHVTLVPWITSAGELKTKPTQHSVKELQNSGIQPHMLLCRCDRPIPRAERAKMASFCNVRPERVIPALDVDTIYAVPLSYHHEGMDREVLRHFGLPHDISPDLSRWQEVVDAIRHPVDEVRVAVVGKYVSLPDAYKSLAEALAHGGIPSRTRVSVQWLDSESLSSVEGATSVLDDVDAVLVAGGFGKRGVEGKVAAVRHARESGKPFLGICLGMQAAVIECARNQCGLEDASSTEFGPCGHPVVSMLTEWSDGQARQVREANGNLGGTMRLGAYPCHLSQGSLASRTYGDQSPILERHRHRYEVDLSYREVLEAQGLLFSGMSPDGVLPEIVERPGHPWFIGVQFHPELTSKPLAPHPLFTGFVEAARNHRQRVAGNT